MKKHYRTIMISDTHLCSRDCRVEDLFSFLKSVQCETLYIVGDFLDIWQLQRRWLWTQRYNDVLRRILGMIKKENTKVVFIPGNHDEVFRNYVGNHFGGIEIAMNAVHETANGKKLFICHGDEFDSVVKYNKWLAHLGSAAYDYLIYLNTFINSIRRLFRLEYWSFASYIKRKVKKANIYIGKFEEAVISEAKKRGTNGVVVGHIHTPTLKEIDGITYCNTGDWVDSCTALIEHANGTLEIIYALKVKGQN